MTEFFVGRRSLLAGIACLGVPSGARVPESGRDIEIGGTDGFESLADPNASAALRATGRVRLYVHDYIWQKLDIETRSAVARVFRETGPASVEVGVSSHGPAFWNDHRRTYDAAGLCVDEAHVDLVLGSNGLSPAQWKLYVDAARQAGLRTVSPIFAPNYRQWEHGPFQSPEWQDIRDMALYGGGITIDSPPWYFLSHPIPYQNFVEAEVIWARSAGIQSSWIFSPPRTAGGAFMAPVRQMLDILRVRGSLPNRYIVENYMAKPPTGFRFVVGKEEQPESIAAVALWMSRNAPRIPLRP
jgi:hypothetical protein